MHILLEVYALKPRLTEDISCYLYQLEVVPSLSLDSAMPMDAWTDSCNYWEMVEFWLNFN